MKKFLMTAIIFSAFNANAQGGYYVKGELGTGIVSKYSLKEYDGKKPDNAGILGIYAGKNLKNNFSIDLSLHRFHDIEFAKTLTSQSESDRVTQSISSNLVGVNLNYTLPVHSVIKPFVSGGLGIAQVNAGEYKSKSVSSNIVVRSKTSHNVAWSAGLGADIKTKSPFDITLSYKFYNLGKATTAQEGVENGKIEFGESIRTRLKVHAITAGIKYNF